MRVNIVPMSPVHTPVGWSVIMFRVEHLFDIFGIEDVSRSAYKIAMSDLRRANSTFVLIFPFCSQNADKLNAMNVLSARGMGNAFVNKQSKCKAMNNNNTHTKAHTQTDGVKQSEYSWSVERWTHGMHQLKKPIIIP